MPKVSCRIFAIGAAQFVVQLALLMMRASAFTTSSFTPITIVASRGSLQGTATMAATPATAPWQIDLEGQSIPLSVVSLLPFAGAGAGLLRSASRYAGAWRFNGSVFDLLEALTGSGAAARLMVVTVFVVAAVLLPRRRPGSRTPLWLQRRRAADLFQEYLLLEQEAYRLWLNLGLKAGN